MNLSIYSLKKLYEVKDRIESLMKAGKESQREIILYGYLRQEFKERDIDIETEEWLLDVTITNGMDK